MQAIDSKRGQVPRNAWIRSALEQLVDIVKYQPSSGYPHVMQVAEPTQKPPTPETERSPEPASESSEWRGGAFATYADGTEVFHPQPTRSKPPLQRPIVQKKG